MDEIFNYLGYQWMSVDNGQLYIGINEEGLEEFTEVLSLDQVDDNLFFVLTTSKRNYIMSYSLSNLRFETMS